VPRRLHCVSTHRAAFVPRGFHRSIASCGLGPELRLSRLQETAVDPIARRARGNVIEGGFLRFARIVGQQPDLVCWRATVTVWVRKIFAKMPPSERQQLLFRAKTFGPLRWLAPRTRQGESPPQVLGRRIWRSLRALASALLYRDSAAWVAMPNSAAISFHERPSRRR